MLRARTLALCVAAWCLLPAPTAGAACNAAAGATYNVSTAVDTEVGQPLVPGSLRYVVERASPGSVIGFCETYLIQLLRPITVPSGKAGLQFVGPSAIAEAPTHTFDGEVSNPNGKFIVEAQNVVFRGLTLTNVEISADHNASGLKVLGNALSMIAPSRNGKSAPVHLEGRPGGEALANVQIGSQAEPNSIVSDQTEAIYSFQTRNLQIVGNAIDGRGTYAIFDNGARNLLIGQNTVRGSVVTEPISGRISANKVTATKLTYGIKVFNDLENFGRVTVEANTLEGGAIVLERDAVSAVRNTVSGARIPGILALCNGPKGGAVGPVRIESNVLTGNLHGLFYRCGPKAAPAVIKGNRAEGNRHVGLGVDGRRVKVDGNQVLANGGIGIQVQAKARARISGGVVRSNGAAGVLVARAAAALISRVAFSGNAGAGIDLLPAGVTPNGSRKHANRNLDWPAPPSFDAASGTIRGTACKRCIVEVFTRETGNRAGNPRNGEGAVFLGTVKAGSNGRFRYPAKSRLTCAQATLITLTATERKGRDPVTSEFSRDITCTEQTTQIDTTVGAPVITGGGGGPSSPPPPPPR